MVVDYLSSTFAALSDPTRRALVDCLRRGPATVKQLAAPFAISQQAISKHLAYLEAARLIERQRQGRQNFCALRPKTIEQVAQWADGYRQLWEANFRRLDTLLAEMKARPQAVAATPGSAKMTDKASSRKPPLFPSTNPSVKKSKSKKNKTDS